MAGSLTRRSLTALLWSTGEGFGVAILSFATFLLLARLLEPQDFGVMALAAVLVFFLNLVTNQGFADAIVQRQRLEPEHGTAAFWCNLALGVALALGCLLAADRVAGLFEEPRIGPVLRWLALALPLNALGGVPLALLRRELRFREIAIATFSGRLVGAAVGIGMALAGLGVWSLVGQQIVGTLATNLALIAAAAWRPALNFSFRHLRDLWGFGLHVSSTQIVVATSEQALNLVIGALYGTTALGYFTIAWRTVEMLRSLIAGAVYQVGLSAFAKLQTDLPAAQRAFLRSSAMSCLVGFPLATGMAILAPEIVPLLFGEKWQASAPLAQILAVGMFVAFFFMFYSALYRAMGRADWVLYIALYVLALTALGVVLAHPWGIAAIVGVWVGRVLLTLPIQLPLAGRLLGLGAGQLLRPAVAPLLATAIMAAGVLAVRWALAGTMPLTIIAAAVPTGVAIYATSLRLLFPSLWRDALNLAKLLDPVRNRAPAVQPGQGTG